MSGLRSRVSGKRNRHPTPDPGPPTVRIAHKRVWVGDESRPLLHGEVHYWRLSPGNWTDALRAIRQLGLDIVSTYVPWEFHELAPGEFDFSGKTDPRRNLVGFLELARTDGLWILLRPGPYIYAEWRNSGIPDRVVQYHRSHPEFRREAQRYLAAVVEAVTPFLATRGGPVVLVQADNEPDPWADVYGAQLGLGTEPGLFQELTGSQAAAVQAPLGPEHGRRYEQMQRFSHAVATDITRWTADTFRALGIDVPIYANSYQSFGVQDWRAMQRTVDLVGPDIYPTAELRGDPAEHRRMLEYLRFTRTFSPLPYIPEFEAGIWHGWHRRIGVLEPNQYRLICLSALLAGIAGWGWYMLVNRDNWSMSPIDELGRARPDLAPEFAAIVRVFRELDPPSLRKLTETAVAVDVLRFDADQPVRGALYEGDIDYECFDVVTGQIPKPLLFYAGGDQPSQTAQRQLAAYVESGGNLVVFQRSVLGIRAFQGVLRDDHRRPLTLHLGDLEVECFSTTFGWYREVPGEPIVAQRGVAHTGQQGGDLHTRLPMGERYVVGYRERRGQGSVTCLGVRPSPEVVVGVHRWLSAAIPSRAQAQNVSTALFEAPNGTRFVLAVNNAEEDRFASIELDVPPRNASELFSGASWLVHGGALQIVLPRKSGTALRLG